MPPGPARDESPFTVGISELLGEDSLCASTCGKWREGRQAPALREKGPPARARARLGTIASFPGRGRGEFATERR